MTDFLRHFKTRDPSVFSDYVIRIFQESSEADTFWDSKQKEWKQEADMFLGRCQSLVQRMIDIDQGDMVLHALVTLKSIHRYGNQRLRNKGLSDAHDDIDELIRAYVTEDVPESCKMYLSESSHSMDKRNHECRIEMGNLNWPARTGKSENRYHNFARAARILRTAYLDEDQYEAPCVYGIGEREFSSDPDDRDYNPYTCFHHSSKDMLDWLQTRAWSEIRSNVLLSMGRILPAEIAERVFESALEVEDIPSRPSVKEKIMVEFPRTQYGRRGRRLLYTKMRSRTVIRTKSLYRCEGFDSEDDDILWSDDDDGDDADYELVELAGTFMDFTRVPQ